MFLNTRKNFEYSNPTKAIEILSNLAEAIRKPMPKASNVETEYVSESLLRVDRGKSFKGHEATVHLTNEGNNATLTVNNKYLGGHVGYYYNVNQGVTEMSITTDFISPKWFQEKLKNLHSLISSNGHQEIEIPLDRDLTKKIRLDYGGATLIDRSETIGLIMYGHRRNISMLSENRRILSRFRKWFKGIDLNQIDINHDKDTLVITNFK